MVSGVLAGPVSAQERAFELVTPLGSLAQIETAGAFSTDDGNMVVFSSFDSFADAVPNGPFPTYDSFMGVRGRDRWTTEWVTDAPDSEPGTVGSRVILSTDDGARQVLQTENKIDPTDTFSHSNDPYLRLRAPEGTRTFTWLTPGPRTGIEFRSVLGATADLRTLLVDAGRIAFAAEDTNGDYDLYLIRDGESPRLVGAPGPSGGRVVRGGKLAVPGTLAADGSYVYFSTADPLVAQDTDTRVDVYRWDDDGTVRMISKSQRTLPGGVAQPSTMLAASGDGDRACFSTRKRLLDGDEENAEDVYCYVVSTDTIQRVSSGLNDGDSNGARPLALSADGRAVFFATASPLTADDLDGGQSLFVHRNGVTSYVTPLAADDLTESRRVASTAHGLRALRVSPDGTSIVFATAANALPAEDTDDLVDVYRWTSSGGLDLISDGRGGWSNIGPTLTGSDASFSNQSIEGRVVTEDFETVFFESVESLVPGDTDGGRIDVYEWNATDGISLITPAGDAEYDSLYLDNSTDGSTVFVVTAEPIHPYDDNAVRDLYAARVGGGHPLPSRAGAGCEGDRCQGEVPAPPTLDVPRSATFDGPADAEDAEPPAARAQVTKFTKAQVRRLARTGSITLRVRVNTAGTVSATATAKIGKRSVRVAGGARTARSATTLRIPLRLSRRARVHLRRTGRLRIVMRVSYSETHKPLRRTVMLRG